MSGPVHRSHLNWVAQAARIGGVVTVWLDIADTYPASQEVARRAGFVPGPTPEELTVPDDESNSAATH